MREVTLAEALRLPLLGGGSVPSLADCLDLVAGRAALLIEIKDQDGQMGSNVGRLEAAVARTLVGYKGPVAVMSFNPESVADMAELAPNVPRGLTTAGWSAVGWSGIPAATRQRLRAIPDFERVGASFISHDARDLDRLRVAELKARGVPVLCWTIRSAEEERRARRIADNVTFECYRRALTAP